MCGLKYRKELIFMTKRKMQIMSPDGDYTTQLMPETDAQYVLTSDGDNVENKITVNTQQINNLSGMIDVPISTRASQSSIDNVKTVVDAINQIVPNKGVWTDARAAKLDNLNQSLSVTQTNIVDSMNTLVSPTKVLQESACFYEPSIGPITTATKNFTESVPTTTDLVNIQGKSGLLYYANLYHYYYDAGSWGEFQVILDGVNILWARMQNTKTACNSNFGINCNSTATPVWPGAWGDHIWKPTNKLILDPYTTGAIASIDRPLYFKNSLVVRYSCNFSQFSASKHATAKYTLLK